MLETNAFAGTWSFNPSTSQLSAPPRSWRQKITIEGDWIEVREDIVRADGSNATVSTRARLDGSDYPVNGSAVVDSIAYTREGDRIVATGKKSGKVALRQSIAASDVQMIIDLAIYLHDKQVVKGFAVFDRVAERATSQAG